MLSPIGQATSGNPTQESLHSLPQIPIAIQIITAPIRAAGEWVWNVVILRIKDDGPALTLLFFGALGIFPLWMNLAMVISGVVLFALKLIEVKKEAEKYRAGYEQQLAMGREVMRCQNGLSDLQTRYGDLEMQYKALQATHAETIERRDAWIRANAEIPEMQKILLEKNRLLQETVEGLTAKNQQLEIENLAAQLDKSVEPSYQKFIQQQDRVDLFLEYQQQCQNLVQQVIDAMPADHPGRVPLAAALYFFQQRMSVVQEEIQIEGV